MSAPTLQFRPEIYAKIRWSRRGSCGNSGCKDPECGCALCGKPVGVAEDDPRFDEHSDFCGGCELCIDQVPFILFRGEGKQTEQATFCSRCFNELLASTARAAV